ncbi:hypothetical protein EYZ11_003656 [Aspergillus tanneri]|uniref:J domain-containing protein n=1 Tax=Aspergillus tanneri TaxID=1220188 RepID=A0A4S3JMQ5_9EURO|nr:hypothetical protein EYZ11_003656 [Aspergillus tanneri]
MPDDNNLHLHGEAPNANQHTPNDHRPDYDDAAAEYSMIMNYPSEADYYALLGLSRTPPPTDAEIRSAFRSLTLSFHPDKQPAEWRDAAMQHFDRIRVAYETLVDPKKRVVYDMLGAEAVRDEWGFRGSMGEFGEARKQQVGVKAMTPDQFRKWFLEMMKRRERRVVNSMVNSRGLLSVGVDASSMVSIDQEEEVVFFNFASPRLSSFELKYSFKTPFPSRRVLFGDDEKEDERDDHTESPSTEGESSQKGDRLPYQQESLDLVIETGVSGLFRRAVNRVAVTMEDGTEEIRDIPRPPLPVAQQVTLGASVSRVFGDVASSKGIFTPSIQARLARMVMPVSGTKPFHVDLTTTFNHSIVKGPPVLGVQVLKEIGRGKHTFCNWSSGNLPWPEFLQVLLSPIVDLGMDLETALSPLNEASRFQFGFLSVPKSPLQAASLDDDEEVQEDEGYKMERDRQRAEDRAAESWQVGFSASPMRSGLSLNYARNIFSGKAATDLALSEWSSEGHYHLPPATEPKSVRIEIQSTIGLDLSVGWNIEGTRQVGDLTRIGLGVGVESGHGLAMTVSWGRLGQRIKLPITVMPLESADNDIAALMVILPWLAYCTWEFGFIRPRERKNRRQVIARRQKQLMKLIPKKKAQSSQAISLMTEQVQRRQAKEAGQSGLVITKAEYGHQPLKKISKGNSSSSREYEIIDVTIPVAALVDHGQLVIPKNMIKFHILGFHDPAPLLPKKLKIWYTYHGKEHYVEANDGEGIACPMRSHLL